MDFRSEYDSSLGRIIPTPFETIKAFKVIVELFGRRNVEILYISSKFKELNRK